MKRACKWESCTGKLIRIMRSTPISTCKLALKWSPKVRHAGMAYHSQRSDFAPQVWTCIYLCDGSRRCSEDRASSLNTSNYASMVYTHPSSAPRTQSIELVLRRSAQVYVQYVIRCLRHPGSSVSLRSQDHQHKRCEAHSNCCDKISCKTHSMMSRPFCCSSGTWLMCVKQ